MNKGIEKAVSLAGSQSELGRLLGVPRQSIHHWLKGVRYVPTDYCIKIHRMYPDKVTLHELRPKVYPA